MQYTTLIEQGEKNHMIISIETKITFVKIQHAVMKKKRKDKKSSRRELPKQDKGNL